MADTIERAGPTLLTTTSVQNVIAAVAVKTVLSHVSVCNSGALTNFTMSIGSDAAGTRLYNQYPIQPNQTVIFPGPIVLRAGEVLQCKASVANTLAVTAPLAQEA